MAVTTQLDSRRRLNALKELLLQGELSTQDELVEELKNRKFNVTQSTISRDLRRLGAVKTLDPAGNTIYRIPEQQAFAHINTSGLKGLLLDIRHNGSMIVIHTTPGSASLLARHLDTVKPHGLLGTLAGDDTVFVAPASSKEIEATMKDIIEELS